VRILSFIETIIVIIIILLTFIYSIPIICLRRFHQPNNIFTFNICVATIFCCLAWIPLFTATVFDNPDDFSFEAKIFLYIAEMIFTIQVPFSLVVALIHRYCSLVYPTKIFFRRKRWFVLCIGSQWILGFVLSIPILVCTNPVRIFLC